MAERDGGGPSRSWFTSEAALKLFRPAPGRDGGLSPPAVVAREVVEVEAAVLDVFLREKGSLSLLEDAAAFGYTLD